MDDRHELLNVYLSPCSFCKHFVSDDYYCPAYPDGIPDSLLAGEERHDTILPDQTGTTIHEKKEVLQDDNED